MKTKVLIILMAIFLTSGCGVRKENKELKQQVATLTQENESLKSGEKRLLATLRDYRRFLNQVEDNLAEIDKNREMVASLNKEVKTRAELADNIRAHMANIAALMENSRLKIISMDRMLQSLRQDSKDASDSVLILDQKIKELTQSLLEKEAEMKAEMATMDSLYELQITELQNSLNRAYYYVGNKKELKESGVVSKEGGFIGLGKVKVLNADAPDSLFVKVKKNEIEEIPFNGTEAYLITNHSEGSFVISDRSVKIIDPEKFWKNGNYAVVEVEK